ncbi:apolipoprotein N-acyltransferase [Pseudonocardia sp. HH130630-07]|uniref:apolipoprotein N-acyltransferase n=1 Tax=Pseudonocardia sp. HH130630-07 TaxID=1690815 RepID=UPI0008152325|nr:apolipoprotein N-acyltransferase [Pseudonocardia sp. HH130630-07]ANY06819.1 apolipoprotein N-acyltransferase [Pseudonocardia sp. HH130630-07]
MDATAAGRLSGFGAPLLRVAVAAAAGVLLHLAFPPRTVWWTAVVAFALLWWVLQGRRIRAAAGLGFAFGLGFYLPHLLWLQNFLGREFGVLPWVGLSALMAVFTTAGCVLVALVSRFPAAPLWGALAYVGQEWVQSRFPLNGFPWGRVAFGQVEGPFLPLAAVGGAPLVSLAVVAAGFSVAALLIRPRELRRAVPVVALVALVLVVPQPPTEAQNGTRAVAVVQGNAPDIGLGLLNASATLRRNHLAETAELERAVRARTEPRPDLMVWPESSTPTDGDDPVLDRVVDGLGVPALIGAYYRAGEAVENAVAVWNPGSGVGERYAKQELVPFAERIPLRPIAGLVTPYVGLSDLSAGTRPGVLDVAGTRVAVGICYEVAYDHVLRDGVRDGGQLLVIPTNNAWYGVGEMTYQQLAMARLRAVEHGRAAVVAALSGVSAVVRPDGTVVRSTDMYTATSFVEQVPLRSDLTLADRWGGPLEHGLALGALLAAAAGAWRRRRTTPADEG